MWAARLARLAAFDADARGRAFLEAEHECPVCMASARGTECTRLACGHAFCNPCLRAHFVHQMDDGAALKIGARIAPVWRE